MAHGYSMIPGERKGGALQNQWYSLALPQYLQCLQYLQHAQHQQQILQFCAGFQMDFMTCLRGNAYGPRAPSYMVDAFEFLPF